MQNLLTQSPLLPLMGEREKWNSHLHNSYFFNDCKTPYDDKIFTNHYYMMPKKHSILCISDFNFFLRQLSTLEWKKRKGEINKLIFKTF